jgi:hypothetical protein
MRSRRLIEDGETEEGGYDPEYHSIMYSSVLDKPEHLEIKNYVINHELEHAKYGKNYFRQILVDVREVINRIRKPYLVRQFNMVAKDHKVTLKEVVGVFCYAITMAFVCTTLLKVARLNAWIRRR